ncbi:hypothetical protein BM43_500 [Burkholderia gladioli]|uniref:Uncharacterized protein n=1 Tax=Burkholderia gladioli TaxID=28095 RepID=A0A095FKN1_BURGA|nr:hypothetical protein [Burkholderia gladioli]AJW97288.1 hypothetical protein BM43_500 [Burkholderia gladioli]ASD80433.1 hypothetical protein CEJ98_16580 [Burkholderia gladioli pv. gladioli]AWY54328.1 hypothetical protein A8H28_24545 [Burkholderia gladioli pv. gladioli]KGC17963.1 hypothetical protein DM48_5144 [Burkholderia gladioli]PEH37384.1 hypothetical protein CRM94_22845 [Burkholderia gladioli]
MLKRELSPEYRAGVEAFMTIARRLDADNIGPGTRHHARPGPPLTVQDVSCLIETASAQLSLPEREGFVDAISLFLRSVITGLGTPVIGKWDAATELEYPEGMPRDDED